MTQQEALTILKKGGNVFLTGEPGAGKTHTVNQFVKWAREQNKRVAITASTGIAATHIDGVTIHSWAGIGIKRSLTDKDIEKIFENDFKKRNILTANILIIDEISMIDADTLNMVDRVLRYAHNFMADQAFGGIQVIFVGDFFQLPPVADRNSKKKVKFAFESEAWEDAHPTVCYITEQHRQEDPTFLSILKHLRDGKISAPHIAILKARNEIPVEIIKSTMLYTHNADVDHENSLELAELEGDVETYKMKSEGHEYPVGLLKKQCLSPEVLELKEGALVMFTRNNWEVGYVNGTIGTVTEFLANGAPVVRTKDGKEIVVLEAEWRFVNNYGNTTASIKQLPLRLAWAMTVHKSQGMSLDQAHIDLSRAFEYGQGYVALSRVRSLAGLTLEGFNKKALMMHPVVVEQDKIFRKMSEKNI